MCLFVTLSFFIPSLVFAFINEQQPHSVTQTIVRKWLSGWDKRVKITIDHNDITTDLSDFPILIYLSSSSGRNNDNVSFVFNELQTDLDRKKIAVTKSDKITECYVEIEKWDSANKKAWLWVKAPSISSTTDTDLYLYYDKDHSENTDYVGDTGSTPAQNVWDGSFKGVWHLKEDPTSTAPQMKDSTSNAHHGTTTGMVAGDQQAAKIDGGLNFDGTDAYVQTTSGESKTASDITWSVWFKADSTTGSHMILWEGPVAQNGWGEPGNANSHEMHLTIGRMSTANLLDFFYGYEYTTNNFVPAVEIQTSFTDTANWHYAVVVLTSADSSPSGTLYLDGNSVGTDTGTETGRTPWNTNLRIGRTGAAQRYMDGILDEVRISNVARSPAWIKASYESGRDHLVDFGSEEVA